MEVILSRHARKFLAKIDDRTHEKVIEALKELQQDPVPYESYDLKKIKGTKNVFRIRIGKVRILYSIEPRIEKIFVEKIDWRELGFIVLLGNIGDIVWHTMQFSMSASRP